MVVFLFMLTNNGGVFCNYPQKSWECLIDGANCGKISS